MKRQTYITIAAIVAALVLSQVNTAFAQQKRKVLIGFKGPSTHQAANDRANAVRRMGGDVHHAFHVMPVVSAELPEAAIAQLHNSGDVAYIEDDHEWYTMDQTTPWGITRINAPPAWSVATGAGVNVAVLDTGVDYDHEDLAGNFAGGVNCVGKHPKKDLSTDPSLYDDVNGHGTHCAGTIAAVNNGIGVVGVAPDVSIWAVKVLGDNRSGYWTDIAQGIEWCIDNGNIRVISMSFGGGYSTTLDIACAAAYEANILVVSSAGNAAGAVNYPAAYDSVMAVSAIDSSNQLASFSNFGQEIELAAPGVRVLSTVPEDGYATESGTSMACPHVSGVAALLWESMESPSASSIRDQLKATASDIGLSEYEQGAGLVNAAAAVGASYEPFTDLAVTRLFFPESFGQGHWVNIAALVENLGNEEVPAGVSVTFEDITDSVTIRTKTITNALPVGGSEFVVVTWYTTNSSIGTHNIEVSHDLPDDNPANDFMTDTIIIEETFTDIAITAVNAPSWATQGDIVSVDVIVENRSNWSVTDINVDLMDDVALINTQTISNIPFGSSTILTFDWDTTTASLGDHTLTACHDFIDQNESNDFNTTTVDVREAGSVKYMYGSVGFTTAGPHLKILITVEDPDQTPVEGIEVYAELDGQQLPMAVTDSVGQVTYTLKSGASSNHDVLVYDLLDTRDPAAYVADGLPVAGTW